MKWPWLSLPIHISPPLCAQKSANVPIHIDTITTDPMFDFAFSEFFLLGIIALIFLGPKELMILFKALGKWVGKLKAMQHALYKSMHDAAQEDAPTTSHQGGKRDDG